MTGLGSRRSVDSAEDQTQCNARTSALIRRGAPLVAVVGFRDADWLERALTGTARGRISIKHSSYKFSKGRRASVAREAAPKTTTTTTRKKRQQRTGASESEQFSSGAKQAEIGGKTFPSCQSWRRELRELFREGEKHRKKGDCMFYCLILSQHV